jgi:hypothetical protein
MITGRTLGLMIPINETTYLLFHFQTDSGDHLASNSVAMLTGTEAKRWVMMLSAICI